MHFGKFSVDLQSRVQVVKHRKAEVARNLWRSESNLGRRVLQSKTKVYIHLPSKHYIIKGTYNGDIRPLKCCYKPD